MVLVGVDEAGGADQLVIFLAIDVEDFGCVLFAEGLAVLAGVFVLGVIFDIHLNLNFCYFITILMLERGLISLFTIKIEFIFNLLDSKRRK